MNKPFEEKMPRLVAERHAQFAEGEAVAAATIRNFRITAADGKTYNTQHTNLSAIIAATNREILQDAGKVTAEITQAHAESEFEKYLIVQDRLFESDFDTALRGSAFLQSEGQFPQRRRPCLKPLNNTPAYRSTLN
jgi:hypothetical protein